jgi:uncharacterized protein
VNLKGTLQKIIDYAVQVSEPEEIILFGSMANGTANIYSDIDLLIISERVINRNEAATRIRDYANQYSLKSDVLIYSQSEYKKELSTSTSFIKAVKENGRIVYKKH